MKNVYEREILEKKLDKMGQFVALIIRNRFYTKIKDATMNSDSVPNYMNVPAAIKELEKIEMIRQADGVYRLDHAVMARMISMKSLDEKIEKQGNPGIYQWKFVRVCLKIHSRHLHAPLRGRFGPNSVRVAHYASFIGAKSPTKCDAQLTESNFKTRSSGIGREENKNARILKNTN